MGLVMNEQEREEFVVPDELAREWKCDVRVVYRAIAAGRLRAVRISHKTIRIPRSSVRELMERSAAEGGAVGCGGGAAR